MISKTFNRYIWLLNTLLQQKRLTFEEISYRWKDSYMGDGKPMPLRTFHQHRNAVEELFGVEIKCDPSRGYEYYIESPELLRTDRNRQWLLNSFSISNMIEAGHNMSDRILFEDIPHGTEYLQLIIEAMQQNKELVFDYQSFGGHHDTYHMQPYAMKVYHQRWYVVGVITEIGEIRNLALDRTLELELTDKTFTFPRNFNAKKYYANTIGVYVNDNLKPVKVRIRAYGYQVDYLRSLPLHRTQEEVKCKNKEFSEFEYRLCITPELMSSFLAMGENVEVLEPTELRNEVKRRLISNLERYNHDEKKQDK